MKNSILLIIVLCMVFAAGCSGVVKEPSGTSIEDDSSAEDDNSDNYESSSEDISDDNSTEQSSVSNDESSNNSEDETSMDDTSIDNGNSGEKVETPFVEYGYKLFVNGEEVEIEDDKIFRNENTIMLSFVTIMTALDAEFEWQSDTVAKMYWADMTFILDVEKCELIHDGRDGFNWIIGPFGGRLYYTTLSRDMLLNSGSYNYLFIQVGVESIRSSSEDGRVFEVHINTTSEYPRQLEYS